MAETEEEIEAAEEETDAEEAPVLPGVVYYLVRSVTRGRTNRTARAMQTGRRGFVQRFAGGTILVRRARPARISEAVLMANLEEIKKAAGEHRVEVTTLSGQRVSLDSFTVAPPAVSKPLPNPPLDSAKNDKNEGIGYKVPPNPTGTPSDAPKPRLLQETSPLDEAPVQQWNDEVPVAVPVEEAPVEEVPAPEIVLQTGLPRVLAESTPTASHQGHKKGKRR